MKYDLKRTNKIRAVASKQASSMICTKCSASWAGLGTGALGAGQHVELQAWQANGNCWFGYLRIMQAEEEDRGAIMSNMFLLPLPLLHHHRHPKDSHSKCHPFRIPKGPYKLDTAHDWVHQPSHSLRPSKFQYSQPFIAIGILVQIMKLTEEHTKVFSSHSRV